MSATRTEARKKRHVRVRKTLRGTAQRPRLAVFRSNRHIYAQVINDDLGTTLAQASSRELPGGPLSVSTAVEVGKLIGARASDADVGEVVFDRGGFPFQGRVKALADAAREAGLKF